MESLTERLEAMWRAIMDQGGGPDVILCHSGRCVRITTRATDRRGRRKFVYRISFVDAYRRAARGNLYG